MKELLRTENAVDGVADKHGDRGGEDAKETLLDYYERKEGKKTVVSDGTFSLIGKCLFFSERKHTMLRLCIPECLIEQVLHLCHDARGHPGTRRTYSSTAQRFYFPKMSRRIKLYVDNCQQCQLSKPSHEKPAGLLQSIEPPDSPCHTLCMDFITGLPQSHGHNALLTVTDAFSKAVRLIPCKKTTTAEETARLFLHHCYPIFGIPNKIISDRDARFTSKMWTTLMKLLSVDVAMTTAFHPQSDGQSERTNQTVEIALRCFLGGEVERYGCWSDYLPILEHELNGTIHETTGFSPNQLRFVLTPKGLPNLLHPMEGTSEMAEQLADDLRNRRDEARDSIIIAQRKQKKYYDASRTPKEFEVGDLVILKFARFGPGYKAPKAHNHKLAPIGTPLRITEKLSPLSYRLALPAESRTHDVVSIAHLRKYRGSTEDIRPLPITVDEVEEYEVERIDRERINSQGTTEYLVKWIGYRENERMWEPAAHLQHADETIATWRAGKADKVARTGHHRSPPVVIDNDDRCITRSRTRNRR